MGKISVDIFIIISSSIIFTMNALSKCEYIPYTYLFECIPFVITFISSHHSIGGADGDGNSISFLG